MIERRTIWLVAAALLGSACATQAQYVGSDTADLPPAGLGRLSQDQISITLQQGDLQIRFLPLDQRVLRLLAPDGYASLSAILGSKRAAVDSIAQRNGITNPGVALVTFFAQRSNVTFQPQDLFLNVRNQIYRPIAIIPYSPGFSNQQIQTRGQASGFFVFELPIPVLEPFQVGYGGTISTGWSDALPTMQRERDRVILRWRQQSPDSMRPSR
ncbi:MAG: hypothetical protein ACHQXA_02895 [Gemmatimonadales bacterium]